MVKSFLFSWVVRSLSFALLLGAFQAGTGEPLAAVSYCIGAAFCWELTYVDLADEDDEDA